MVLLVSIASSGCETSYVSPRERIRRNGWNGRWERSSRNDCRVMRGSPMVKRGDQNTWASTLANNGRASFHIRGDPGQEILVAGELPELLDERLGRVLALQRRQAAAQERHL